MVFIYMYLHIALQFFLNNWRHATFVLRGTVLLLLPKLTQGTETCSVEVMQTWPLQMAKETKKTEPYIWLTYLEILEIHGLNVDS